MRRLAIAPFILSIRLYQLTLSPLIGNQCRFHPTCSRYSVEAFELHGPLKGSWLTLRRLLRCHPWGGHGYDPPPLPPSMVKCGPHPDPGNHAKR
ncbi:MAG: membrane protein insertion efficiency factor YidD [Phycisphaerales bacterium]